MRPLLALLLLLLASGCALHTDRRSYNLDNYAEDALPAQFDIVSWNIWKGRQPGAMDQLRSATEETELVLIQEFTRAMADDLDLGVAFGRSWHPILQPRKTTGVAILSKVAPSHLQALPAPWHEGYILTPKMSLAATLPLADGRELMVINVQALEFHFTSHQGDQLERVRAFAAGHQGPVIIAGDFATWRQDRTEQLREILSDYTEVTFDPDTRGPGPRYVKRLQGDRGLPSDHIFVRGLTQVGSGRVIDTKASDHDVLAVTLQVSP